MSFIPAFAVPRPFLLASLSIDPANFEVLKFKHFFLLN